MKNCFLPGLFFIIPIFCIAQKPLPAFKVIGNKVEKVLPARDEKMAQALMVFEKVMNDADFKKELLSLTFAYDVINDAHSHFTTKQVVDKIYDAKEWYSDTCNHTADIYWQIEKKRKPIFDKPSMVYGSAVDTTIVLYSYFFDKSDNLPELVGNIANEWAKKLGFESGFKSHQHREKTVPFAFGELVEKYAIKYDPKQTVQLVSK